MPLSQTNQERAKTEVDIETFESRDRNVYILGAGFSAPAGAPLINGFLDRSRSYLDAPMGFIGDINRSQRKPFETVFKYKSNMARAREKVSIDLDNIEELFGLVEIASRLNPANHEVRDCLALMICRTLEWATEDSTQVPRVRIGPFDGPTLWHRDAGLLEGSYEIDGTAGSHYVVVDIYTFFAALAVGSLDDPMKRRFRKDTVITFNYDLVFDCALHRAGVSPDYHLPESVEDSNWTPPPRRFPLLKLHGSINWGVCSACRTQLRMLYPRPPTKPLWYPLQMCAGCKERTYLPLVVPPSWDKSGYRDVLSPVWAKAVEELRTAKRICVIGYSMPKSDAFFRYLFTLALTENDRLSDLIVVDKGPQVMARWQEWLEPLFVSRRFHFHSDGVAHYVASKDSLAELGRGECLISKTVSLQ